MKFLWEAKEQWSEWPFHRTGGKEQTELVTEQGVCDTPNTEKMTNRRKNGENSMFSPFFYFLVNLYLFLQNSAYAPVPLS